MCWIHNGEIKSDGSKTADLTFSTVSKADAGFYKCKANNSARNKDKQVHLVVNCEYVNHSITCTIRPSEVKHINCEYYLRLVLKACAGA